MNRPLRTLSLRIAWTVGGAIFGAFFPFIGWITAADTLSANGIRIAHRDQPVLWIVDLAPLVLALAGAVIGRAYSRLAGAHLHAEHLAENRTRQLKSANQRLSDSIASREHLVAAISHELRTPVTAIVGFGSELLDAWLELDEPHRQEIVAVIAAQAQDLADMLDDLLVAGRVELGHLTVTREQTDLGALAAECLNAFRRTPDLRTTITDELTPAPVEADPGRIRQIVRNLLTNAEKYGGDRVTVTSGIDGSEAFVRVADNGTGVAQAESEAIFAPYQRAAGASQRSGSMGLGLSVSRTLARLMGGEVGYSREGDRTVFELRLPLADIEWPVPLARAC